MIFVFRDAIPRLLGMSTVPPPLFGVFAFAGAIALLGRGRAVLVGSRSLSGGFNQRPILTLDGFVVDGGAARAVPFGDIVPIEQRNWAVLFTRRESLSSGFWGPRITRRDGTTDTWEVDYRFERSWEVEALILGAFAQYQRLHGLAQLRVPARLLWAASQQHW